MPSNDFKNFNENSSFLIVGTVRNCEKYLNKSISQLTHILGKVKDLHWFLVESDSEDDTLNSLSKLKETNNNFNYITLGRLRDKFRKRTDRLAYCRNLYKEHLDNNLVYSNIDYVIVSDFDGVNDKLTANAFNSCWDNKKWDVCTANQDGPYYDIWALRHKYWSPNDCWAQYNFLNKYNSNTKKNLFTSVYSRMIKIPPDSPWIEVDSAFGGIAIYKKEIFKHGIYKGLDENGDEICEHVYFHQMLKKIGAQIYINPKFINAAYTNHTKKSIVINDFFFMIFSKLSTYFTKKINQSIKK